MLYELFMINDKGLLYLIQPAELVGTQRYKIGYSKNTDLDKFRRDYKKGSRFLDIYEYEHSPLLVREIRSNFNNKFRLVAGRTYYEGNENDIKKNFNDIIKSYCLVNNSGSQNLSAENNNVSLVSLTGCLNGNNEENVYNKYTSNKYTSNKYTSNKYTCNKYFPDEALSKYTYIQNIVYGSQWQKEQIPNFNKSY
jgi:hypothetical protein